MSEKLIVRGAAIHMVDLRPTEAGPVARLHFVADLTPSVALKFNWIGTLYKTNPEDKNHPYPRDGYTMMKLDGEQIVESLSLVVSGMEKHALEIVAREAIDFSAHRIEEEDGTRVRRELRFKILTTGEALIPVLDYLLKCGFDTKGRLDLTCATEEQQTLDIGDDKPSRKRKRKEDPETETETEGESLPVAAGPVLASSREVNGHHQTPGRRKRGAPLPPAPGEIPEDEQSPASVEAMKQAQEKSDAFEEMGGGFTQ